MQECIKDIQMNVTLQLIHNIIPTQVLFECFLCDLVEVQTVGSKNSGKRIDRVVCFCDAVSWSLYKHIYFQSQTGRRKTFSKMIWMKESF